MISFKTAYQQATERLEGTGVPEAKTDAWYLLEHVTGMHRAEYFLRSEDAMPEELLKRYGELVEKRSERIPLQYITGSQEFMGFEFKVSPATLIPRQDTEILVEEVSRVAEGKRVLDLCTGTGCIIISLAKLCKLAKAMGTDISEEAVETAERNAEALCADAAFFQGNLFCAVPEGELFDIIVSNPPYIPSEVLETLMPEVKDHEPLSALDGDRDGLKFYREIIKNANKYLVPGGMLFFEIGCEQAAELEKLLETEGFSDIRVTKDLAGLDRVVSARLERMN